ncbi:MAG: sulfatase-like hydrolase/transferase [Phycisphaerales bacterium]|nr:sulfatase-like hydrolase/transferase [Phycisphaerales bacterium]
MASNQPNILFLFTDMQRADTIHALGNAVIQTPNLDRLVREGTSFTNAYSPCPVCVPARCCMHYGLYPQKTGLFDNGKMMEDNGASYPQVLGEHGYRTHAIGKCHFTPEHRALRGYQSRQIQEEIQSKPESDDYIAWLRDNNYDYYESHGARGEMYYIPQISSLPAHAHPTQWIGDESVRHIRENSGKGQPWLLFSSFIHPHPPLAPPKPWHRLYRSPDMPMPIVPEHSQELQVWINRNQNRYKYRDRGIDDNLVRLIKAYYYACISFVDYQIGRIMHELEATGQLENTLVLFASDHGEFLGDLNCFGKRSMHDASARVPMIIRFPQRYPAGTRCDTAVSLVDIYPTILAACGITQQNIKLDGIDVASVVSGAQDRRTVFSQFRTAAEGIYMAVNRDWKYVYSAGDIKEFFFDRQSDPQELINLAKVPKYDAIKMEMKNELLRFLQANGRTDAYSVNGAKLDWQQYPKINEDYLKNPDSNLIFQDYPSYPTKLPGYIAPETRRRID